MATVTLNLLIPTLNKATAFKTPTDITVFDLCRHIQSTVRNAGQGPEFGIFINDPDPKHSFWLESSRLLSYYHLQDGMEIVYKSKLRRLIVSTLDGTRKTLQVDDSKTIADLMVTICGKMGITNHEEYSLIHEKGRAQTLRRPKNTLKDYDKLETLKHKLQTDDGANWLPHAKTFRQLGIEETDILLLQRKYFFSDQNIGTRDPVQLNLLFIQLKEAILNGAHPISLIQAIELAGLQCQAEMGNLIPEKAKSFSIDVKEHLPKEYVKVKNVEKKIREVSDITVGGVDLCVVIDLRARQYQKLNGLSEKDAKVRYIQVCRSLPTYGITFFLIKEKLQGKNKLVPRLFGVSKESVMRVDENTKEVLQTWPLTRVRRWAATANLFTLDFGEYSPDGNYVMQTTEGEQISQLISGYIDIILRRKKKSDACVNDDGDSNVILEENVGPSRAEIISNVGTLGRGHNVSASYVATEGYPSQASTFSRGYVGRRSGDNLAERGVDNTGVALRAHTLGGKRRGTMGNEVQMKELSQPKRAVMLRIGESTKEIQDASQSLSKPYFEDKDIVSRDDSATQRWREENMAQARAGICSYLGAMTIATGNLISLLRPSQSRLGENASQEGMAEETETEEEEDAEEAIDYTTMDASLATIGLNVHRLMQNVRVLDQLQAVDAGDESQGHLMSAAQNVADAFLNLMRSAMPLKAGREELGALVDRPSLYEAASRVGDSSQQLLQLVSASHLYSHRRRKQRLEPILEDEDETNLEYGDYESDSEIIANAHAMDWQLRDDLLAATKDVASATANLVKHAKSAAVAISQEATELANTETDSTAMALQRDEKVAFLRDAQSLLVHAATHAGKTTSRLVTSAKVAVCTMEQPASQRQLLSCVKQVSQAVDQLSDVARKVAETSYLPLESMEQRSEQQKVLGDLHHAANHVSSTLESLMNRLVAGSIQAQQDPVVISLLGAGEQVTAALGDGEALFQQASHLAQTATALVEELRTSHDILGAAGISESEVNLRANLLSRAITDLLESLKALESGNKQSLPHQQETVAAANRLIEQANKLAAPIIRTRLTTGLEFATRLTASNASQLATISEEAARHTRSSQYRLLQELDQLSAEVIPQVNLTCDTARAHPHDPDAQNSLVDASKNLMDCLKDFIGSVDIFAPTVTDAGIQVALTNAARNTEACLVDLRQCCATAKPILQSPLPTLDDLKINVENVNLSRRSSQTPAVVKRQAWPSISTRLANMQTELDSNSDHCLPGQTVDSVCGDMLAAVSRFKDAFEADGGSGLPEMLSREAELIANGSAIVGVGPDRLPPVTAKLLNSLESVINATRGLAGFLSSLKDSASIEPDLERVLLSSWSLLSDSLKDQAGRTFARSPSQELSVAFAAEGIRAALLTKGLQCIEKAHASLLWAVHEEKDYKTAKRAVADSASELQAAIDELRNYVPGAQVASKLGALVAALPKAEGRVNGHQHADQIPPSLTPLSAKNKDPNALLKALAELAEASEEASRIAGEQSSRRRANESATSSTCSLAMAADRLANALYDVLDAFNRESRDSSANEEILADLRRLATPLATELERALISEGVVQTPVNVMFVSKASLSLRDWVVNVTKATQAQMAKETAPQDDSTELPDRTLKSVRSQLSSALTRLQPPAGSGRDVTPLIAYPVAKLTYLECIDELDDLSQTLGDHMDGLENSTRSSDANAFCDAVQGVADAVMGMIQAATQSAYLVGAGQPCNEPGRAPRLLKSEARQITEDADCLHRNLDIIVRDAPTFSTNVQRATQLAPALNDVTRASSSMCQITRQCIAESVDPSEKKILAENAKDVAQTTTHLVKALNIHDPSAPSNGDQVVEIASGLKNSASKLANSLQENGEEMPVQVLPEATEHQAPILIRGRTVIEKAENLTETAGILFKAKMQSETYNEHRKALESASQDLRSCICDSRPGFKALKMLKSTSRELLRRLDQAGLQQYTEEKMSNLEAKGLLLNSSLHQLAALSGKMAGDWRHSRWELVSQDAHLISSYLPNVALVCISSCSMLKRSSDQAALQSYLRTVLETTGSLSTRLLTQMNSRFGGPPDPDPSPISANTDQLRLACRELLICVEDLIARQGSLNSQIASIEGACKKLEGNSSPPYSLEQVSAVALQTRLASQAQTLVLAGGRLSEASKSAGSSAEEAAANQLVQQFIKTAESTQQLTALLNSQSGYPENSNATSRLSDRIRMVVHGIGTSCAEVLENPRNPESLRALTSRVSSLVAVLRESAHGVHACVNAVEGIARKVTDFDSAIYFARANSLVDRSSVMAMQSAVPSSPTLVANEVQASQEEIMHLLKGIVEETNALSRNTTRDQDKLAVSAQNCLLYVNNLHAKTLNLLSRPDLDAISPASEDARTEARVSLLSMARAVSANLIDLLTHSRNLVTAEKANLPTLEAQLNSTAADVVSRVGELRSSLRSFSEVFVPPRAAFNPPKLTPVAKSPRTSLTPTASEDSATASVRTGLQSVLATLRQLGTRLDGWIPESGTFSDGDTIEFEREVAANKITTPRHIQEAALGITQAALKANSATASGRKLADISVAGEVIHKVANDLVRRLRCGTRAVMLKVAAIDANEVNVEKTKCATACTRAIEGGKSTLQELAIMVENMIKSLDDPGSGQPPAMQVTLAMRRLRETVYEIVEGVKQMPEDGDVSSEAETPSAVFRQRETTETARPMPHHQQQQPKRPALTAHNLSTLSELASSIKEAANIATDVGDAAGTEELRGFTSEIEQSMQKLSQLQTKAAKKSSGTSKSPVDEGEDDEFSGLEGLDAILATCKRLAHATASLMHWATAAQRELVKQGRLKPVSENVDESEAEFQWTCGLVSAARYVSAATVNLVESAETLLVVRTNDTSQEGVRPRFAPEDLVSAARTVMSNTGQLIFACLAKADANSASMRGLNAAASEVRRHAERLIELTELEKGKTDPDELLEPSGPRRTTVEAMREVIETKASIASKMAELERLQNRLKAINQESYRHKDHDENEL